MELHDILFTLKLYNLFLDSYLVLGLTEYFAFYNGERYHQALNYKTPDQVYQAEEGGGAMIVDKFIELTGKDTTGGLHVDKA